MLQIIVKYLKQTGFVLIGKKGRRSIIVSNAALDSLCNQISFDKCYLKKEIKWEIESICSSPVLYKSPVNYSATYLINSSKWLIRTHCHYTGITGILLSQLADSRSLAPFPINIYQTFH